ncbi:MAG: DUF2817 domain-containing protein [Gammaproteobacteria bacterium]|nr:DUF2817 domain-containing protein [Gammaproteobacteria bacterium]
MKTMRQASYFSANYPESRKKFLALATRAGATINSRAMPDPHGETRWFVDTAWLGPQNAEKALLIVSGTHGVEGFAGSACQCALLDSLPETGDMGLLLVHALNPWGFDHLRRCNEHNVDLNRNFVDFSAGPPANDDYAALDDLLLPPDWHGARRLSADLQLYWQLFTGGRRKLQAAISAGQYEFPQGLFYGGQEAEWSHRVWREILAEYRHRPLMALDIHTGLGAYGKGRLLTNLAATSADYAVLQGYFGGLLDSSAGSSPISARTSGALIDTLPADSRSLVLEFGTFSARRVLNGLRREAIDWRKARQHDGLKKLFCPDDPAWRQSVLDQFLRIVPACLSLLNEASA